MKTLRYRFYDAKAAELDGKPMTAVDRLIMLRSNLTHAEIQFDTNRGEVSFSSTPAECADGCRFMYIQYSHPKRWRTLQIQVEDTEEQAAWVKACQLADMETDWQSQNHPCTFKGTTQEGQDVMACSCKDITVYHGPDHIRYDLIGLMSFALEKSPTWWRNIQRWALWAWTVIIRPDPVKMWCSEACSVVFNSMILLQGRISHTEIDSQDLYDYLRNLKGVKEI
jgi:hypothetical protein